MSSVEPDKCSRASRAEHRVSFRILSWSRRRGLARRRGRVVQARACKALYMGSIPIVASSFFGGWRRCCVRRRAVGHESSILVELETHRRAGPRRGVDRKDRSHVLRKIVQELQAEMAYLPLRLRLFLVEADSVVR